VHYVTTDADDLALRIGARVKQARSALGWSLDRLASRSGVSRRMVVNVEQGTTNPSITTLLRLSDALGIGLPELVDPGERTPLRVSRSGELEPVWRSENGGAALLAAGTEPPDVVELWDWVLGPGDEHVSEAHRRGTRELMLVLQGRVRLRVGDQSDLLSAGDSASFHGDVVHAYSNPSPSRTSRFVLTVLDPDVGSEIAS
jgi:transcriptional regulator with XRE-family HTH domain